MTDFALFCEIAEEEERVTPALLINWCKPPPLVVVQAKVLPLQAGPQRKSSDKF